ncbi:DinB family protein [Limnoglobus roseus]|uniref:DinB-like domain-containing protein n=1 Tax=Limnoglobus roseus TaxID=2598579 RepID=A0A5C1A9H2_9BACT|nr:DinB family protein [Limnoglobus roseus]QEL13764.1 hypothetical protein PX52LOC_00622 [Limnoglobus roseus]
MPTAAEYAAQYRQGAADLRAAVAGMTREQVTARPVPGKWSTLEVVAHLADFEPILVERMKRILATDDAKVLPADENLFAKALHYDARDLAEELAVVDATRASTARIIEKLTPEQLARTGEHVVKGPVTLESVIQMAIRHINTHLPFIAEKRKALGI